jgi:predicted amidohydrolase
MNEIKVALLQMNACGTDQDANCEKGDQFCRQAKTMGADITLFPEMWNIGYTFYEPDEPGAHERWTSQAIAQDSEFVSNFVELAKELNMAIALTYLERWKGSPRNTVSLIDRHGEIALTYAKLHTCDFDIERSLTPGEDFYVCDLDTEAGTVKIGAMICYDREFPESARILMLKGAEIILTPNACNLGEHRIGQFKSRAYENMVGVAMTNYPSPGANGHSVAFSPVAFGADEKARDTLIIEAGESEGIYLAIFDMDQIRDYRQHEIWGNAYRRPHKYSLLTSLEVAEPFTRKDTDGNPYQRQMR